MGGWAGSNGVCARKELGYMRTPSVKRTPEQTGLSHPRYTLPTLEVHTDPRIYKATRAQYVKHYMRRSGRVPVFSELETETTWACSYMSKDRGELELVLNAAEGECVYGES